MWLLREELRTLNIFLAIKKKKMMLTSTVRWLWQVGGSTALHACTSAQMTWHGSTGGVFRLTQAGYVEPNVIFNVWSRWRTCTVRALRLCFSSWGSFRMSRVAALATSAIRLDKRSRSVSICHAKAREDLTWFLDFHQEYSLWLKIRVKT
jgi:hypothetical protein